MFSENYSSIQVTSRKGYDEGLRKYMLNIYNLMAAALAVTGVFAMATLSYPPLTSMLFNIGPNGNFIGQTGLGTIVMWAPLLISIYFFWFNNSLSIEGSKALFWVYAALMGMSLSSLGFLYTGTSIARTFFITASVFGGMSIYGYTTKKDLTAIGSFLVMGLIGLILASIVNIFLASPAIYFATSILGVVIFTGLIAWDTQKLKQIYFAVGGGEAGQKAAIMGAFSLYLDFINLFLHLLRFFGDRR